LKLNTSIKSLLKVLRPIILIGFIIITSPLFSQQAQTYEEAITLADKNLKENNLLDAKAYYQIALKYKTDDVYANEQIIRIVEMMKTQLSKEDEYYDIIDLADVLYDGMALDKAIEQYRKALQIIPGDEYAKNQIASIEKLQLDQQDKINAFETAMSNGNNLLANQQFDEAIQAFKEAQQIFPDKSMPGDQINLAKSQKETYNANLILFNEQIEEAQRYLLVKNYATALEHFENAYEIFPENEEVNAWIAEVKPKAENQRKYNARVDEADELYISKDFMGAMSKYNEAAELWPENSYPHDMIGKINEQLALQRKDLDKNYNLSIAKADSLLTIEEYTSAQGQYKLALTLKPGEIYPTSKLTEIDAHFAAQRRAFEEDYANLVAKADSLFDARQYTLSADQYEFALTIRPDDNYPKERLIEIENQLAAIAAQEKLESEYLMLIAEADGLFAAKQFDQAKGKYTEAQEMKPEEAYPGQRMAEIQLLLVNAAAQKELDEKYSEQMLLASRLFGEDKLAEAKVAYQVAMELKSYEPLPKQKIEEIDSITDARIRQAEIDAIYRVHLQKGDSLFNLQEYANAIIAYAEALAIKPAGKEAQVNADKARTLKAEMEDRIARQETYDNAIREGENLLASKNYELAKTEFEKAAEAKPAEAYPPQKITEINTVLAQLAAERQQRYDEAITKADVYFTQGNYKDALIEYKIARSIKPEESYPNAKIAESEKIIEEELKVIRGQYDVVIAEADNLYNSRIYDKAIQSYQQARSMLPDEPYPIEMIKKITKYLDDNAITDVVKERIVINSEVTERFDFDPIPVNVRKSNYVLVKARNLTKQSFKMIFSYGGDNGKNGGFVVQVPQDEEMNDFIIRVGNQYKWFAEDNNWMSIYSQNGDIEISIVRITTSN
jgi:tetratricopeptide (TPR) repeat protein